MREMTEQQRQGFHTGMAFAQEGEAKMDEIQDEMDDLKTILRDQFAAHALTGLLMRSIRMNDPTMQLIVRDSWRLAQAMLDERARIS